MYWYSTTTYKKHIQHYINKHIQKNYTMEKEQVMNWKPMGDQVLLKVEKKSEKTKSGIILVDRDMAFVLGEVVKTGDGLFTQTGARIPLTVKAGDTVYVYKSNLGENKEIVLDDDQYMLIRESEIAVVND